MTLITKFAPLTGAATALAAALTLPLAAPLSAGETSSDIVVSSKAAMERWQSETTRDLNQKLLRAPMARSATPNDTIVQVVFTLGEDGKAENVKVLDGNANWAARKSAIFAVKRLDGLADVPVSNPQGAKFLANIVFADDTLTARDLFAQLETSERARLAAADQEDDYILLGG